MSLRWSIPDKSPVCRCKTCGEEVVLVKKNGKVLFIGYDTVKLGDRDKLVGYEHRCKE